VLYILVRSSAQVQVEKGRPVQSSAHGWVEGQPGGGPHGGACKGVNDGWGSQGAGGARGSAYGATHAGSGKGRDCQSAEARSGGTRSSANKGARNYSGHGAQGSVRGEACNGAHNDGGARADCGEGKADRRVGARGSSANCYGGAHVTLTGGSGGSLNGGKGRGQGVWSNAGSDRSDGYGVNDTERAQLRETSRGSAHANTQRRRGLHQAGADRVEAEGAGSRTGLG
jgi:hypothetical protein